jgi:hypothetical protein
MWRVSSLFGHTTYPDHHAAMHTETHESLTERMHHLGDHMGQSIWGSPAVLCHVCHAELQPHEFAKGCCDDTDACGWRSLSERCCW